ncbi:MAG: hypothetical protein H7X71_01800 [Chitinophagales bacterium]|nr:hypothetical protein [Chitinophagales bacterium]
MKKFYFFCILTLIWNISSSQVDNHVPNGDFEEYTSCPSDYSQIDSALYWLVPTSFNSTDYYHTCATSSAVSVPFNGAGY